MNLNFVCSRCQASDSRHWYKSSTSCLCEQCARADDVEPAELEEVWYPDNACWVCGAPTNEAEDLCGPCAAQRADTLRLVEELEAKGYGVK